MRILHIAETTAGASGVATFVRVLDSSLKAAGIESHVICARGKTFRGEARNTDYDIVHIHGLWLPFFHSASNWAHANGIPVVWSTHGMSAPWAMHHKWCKKLIAWWLYQRRDLMHASAIHCTTEQEVSWNRRHGLGKFIVAPLGTAVVAKLAHSNTQLAQAKKVLLFVGRVHPVKGLENLFRAWQLTKETALEAFPALSWQLRIVGPDEDGYMSFLKSLSSRLSIEDSVEFAGPKFGNDLAAEYDACDCLVLPSFTENFGATVIDGMAHGKPCIASKFTPWEILQERGCGWWVSNDPPSLATAITEMISLEGTARDAMGERGRNLVEEKYTWPAITKEMIAGYSAILRH